MTCNIKAEKRLARAQERLGTFSPRCIHCGEDHPHCLEKHHIGSSKHDEATVITCRNCHRKVSDPQKDHPKPNQSPATPEERIGLFLLGLADLFAMLIGKLREFGHSLLTPVANRTTTTAGAP